MVKEANASLDALDRGTLEDDLPGAEAAFDRDAMAARIQGALIGLESSNRVTTCSLSSAILLDDCIVFRYHLDITKANGKVVPALVTGRLFADAAGAQAYIQRLAPLVEQVLGRDEIAALTTPVAMLEDLGMALYAFPIDGELPTLVAATSDHAAGRAIEQLLEASGHSDITIHGFRAEPVHYNRRHRCMMRYHLDLGGGKKQAIYGKVAGDNAGARIPGIVAALAATFAGAGVAVPECYGYLEDLQLVAFSEIPGIPRVAQLLKARLRGGTADGSPTLEEAVAVCGRIAAALHTSGLKLGEARSLEVELDRLRAKLPPILRLSPEIGERLSTSLDEIAKQAHASTPLDLCQCHGDFSYTQLIFEGPHAGLVDFDNFSQAEPSLDLGQFLAYLRYAGTKARGPSGVERSTVTENLAQTFAESYVEAGGRPEALERVGLYEATNMIRMAEHAWQNLKPLRLNGVVTVLAERMAT